MYSGESVLPCCGSLTSDHDWTAFRLGCDLLSIVLSPLKHEVNVVVSCILHQFPFNGRNRTALSLFVSWHKQMFKKKSIKRKNFHCGSIKTLFLNVFKCIFKKLIFLGSAEQSFHLTADLLIYDSYTWSLQECSILRQTQCKLWQLSNVYC